MNGWYIPHCCCRRTIGRWEKRDGISDMAMSAANNKALGEQIWGSSAGNNGISKFLQIKHTRTREKGGSGLRRLQIDSSHNNALEGESAVSQHEIRSI